MTLDVQLALYSVDNQADDEIGGAQVTGTFVRNDVWANLQEAPVNPAILQQGLEVARIFDCWLQPINLDVQPGDELEVVAPSDHPFYNRRLEVVKTNQPALHRAFRIGFLELQLRLRDYSR